MRHSFLFQRPRWLRPWNLFPLVWLVWLFFPIIAFVSHPSTLFQQLAFWGGLAVFVWAYNRTFLYYPPEDRRAYLGWAISLGMWLLGLWLFPGSAFTFLIYGCTLIGWQRHQKVVWLGSGLNLLLILATALAGRSWGEVIYVVFGLVGAYGTHNGYMTNEATRRLHRTQAEKERLAADAERERIARDLHDLLGHTLSVIVLKSELAGKLAAKDPAKAAEEIREVERISREALSEVRSAVRGYRGSGFASELARAKVALDAAGVKLALKDTAPPLAPEAEASAAMLLREAVTNVVRHAHAREVQISWAQNSAGTRLVIQDDGVGGLSPEGTGLNSMRERLRAIGGTLERDGSQGTRLVASLPMPPIDTKGAT